MASLELYSCIFLAISWLALLAFSSKLVSPRRRLRFAPGPRPWPLIGNLNHIGSLPHQSFDKLSQTYGPLMQLKFGSTPILVASSPQLAEEILKSKDQVLASRPQTAAGKHITYNYLNIGWAPYGPYWRQARRICLTEIFSPKRLDSYEYIREEEKRAFMSRLHGLSGKPVKLKEQVTRVTLSVISRIVLGQTYFTDKSKKSIVTLEEFQGMIDEVLLLNGVFHIGDWIPGFDFLDLQGYVKRMKALKKKFNRFHDHVIEEHKAKGSETDDLKTKDDVLDVLLKLSNDPNLEVQLTSDSIKGFTQDLLAGGMDTSATTIEWAMSELMKQPHLIDKATEELDRVTGRERWVEERDFPQLPYIDCIMKEAMRLHPVSVVLPPHLATEDCQIGGYDVVKGTIVFVATWSMGRNAAIWDEPQVFKPERFLGGGGKEIDVRGKNYELLPFGSGRRMCPGYNLALKMVRSSLANLLLGFNWKLTEDMKPEDINMDEVYGLSTKRKDPLVTVVEPRLHDNLYH